MRKTSETIRTVQAWHQALNRQDKEALAILVKDDVKIGGPRGSVEGRHVMMEWLDRARVSFIPKRYFAKDPIVVVEALGEWHAPETDEVTGNQTVATVFVVEDNLITSISRYEHLKDAFEASGLNERDEISLT